MKPNKEQQHACLELISVYEFCVNNSRDVPAGERVFDAFVSINVANAVVVDGYEPETNDKNNKIQ